MKVHWEYNAAVVYATSSENPASRVDLGYELLRRVVGTREWQTVRKTDSWEAAQIWAAQSGYKVRKLRNS